MGKIVLVVAMLAVLVGAVWFGAASWRSLEGEAMPATFYVAMALGVGFSVLVGAGLMALVFYSHRHGYDEPARRDERGGDKGHPEK